jgi:hypothetical protein
MSGWVGGEKEKKRLENESIRKKGPIRKQLIRTPTPESPFCTKYSVLGFCCQVFFANRGFWRWCCRKRNEEQQKNIYTFFSLRRA